MGMRVSRRIRDEVVEHCEKCVLHRSAKSLSRPHDLLHDLLRFKRHTAVVLSTDHDLANEVQGRGFLEMLKAASAHGFARCLHHLDLSCTLPSLTLREIETMADILEECHSLAHLNISGNTVDDAA